MTAEISLELLQRLPKTDLHCHLDGSVRLDTVLDLATMTETTLAETNSVDDQAEWLDNATIAYALPEDASTPGSPTDVWTVAADGSGTPRLLVPRAASPAIIH